ncbi:MAG: hypothetical protein HKL96_09130 [Phycisphaerales bacterium]|nr:hypothetical protein [Phycisphaerales bacterium]
MPVRFRRVTRRIILAAVLCTASGLALAASPATPAAPVGSSLAKAAPSDLEFPVNGLAHCTQLSDGSLIVPFTDPNGRYEGFYTLRLNAKKWMLVQPREAPGRLLQAKHFEKIIGGSYGKWYIIGQYRCVNPFNFRIAYFGPNGNVVWLREVPPYQACTFVNTSIGSCSLGMNFISTTDGGLSWIPQPPLPMTIKPPGRIGGLWFASQTSLLVYQVPRQLRLLRRQPDGRFIIKWSCRLGNREGLPILAGGFIWILRARPAAAGAWTAPTGQIEQINPRSGRIADFWRVLSAQRQLTVTLGAINARPSRIAFAPPYVAMVFNPLGACILRMGSHHSARLVGSYKSSYPYANVLSLRNKQFLLIVGNRRAVRFSPKTDAFDPVRFAVSGLPQYPPKPKPEPYKPTPYMQVISQIPMRTLLNMATRADQPAGQKSQQIRSRYLQLVRQYCGKHGIKIPKGFPEGH